MRLIYIGASTDIAKRLSTHGSSDFTHYRHVKVRDKSRLLKIERHYLRLFKPPRNHPNICKPLMKNHPQKRAGFYCELPISTISTIKKRSSATKPQWRVIQEAVDGITVKKGVVQMIVMPAKKAKKRSGK